MDQDNRPPRTPREGRDAEQHARIAQQLVLIREQLDADKAESVIVIDLEDRSNLADYIIIASGRSSRQVAAMAQHLASRLKEVDAARIGIEGLPRADWVLIDTGDIIVHLFRPEVRNFYNLEKIWGLELPVVSAVAAGTAGVHDPVAADGGADPAEEDDEDLLDGDDDDQDDDEPQDDGHA